ncbi:hypothetical protein [Actinoplanes sp. NPDC020271]
MGLVEARIFEKARAPAAYTKGVVARVASYRQREQQGNEPRAA